MRNINQQYMQGFIYWSEPFKFHYFSRPHFIIIIFHNTIHVIWHCIICNLINMYGSQINIVVGNEMTALKRINAGPNKLMWLLKKSVVCHQVHLCCFFENNFSVLWPIVCHRVFLKGSRTISCFAINHINGKVPHLFHSNGTNLVVCTPLVSGCKKA